MVVAQRPLAALAALLALDGLCTQVYAWRASATRGTTPCRTPPRLSSPRRLVMADAESGPSPEAWREFRAQLIAGGIKVTTDDGDSTSVQDAPASPSAQPERVVVAPKNEQLLRTQNEALWNEYINGAWAHVCPPEPGALMCRLPLPAQLVECMRQRPEGASVWGDLLRDQLRSELPSDGGAEGGRAALFTKWSANTAYCYRLAEAAIAKCLRALQARASARGSIDASSLEPAELELLDMYSGAQEAWQEVCLVTATPAPDRAQAVVINRPLAKGIDVKLAKLLVGGEQAGAPPADEGLLLRFERAFGEEAAVYLGGPQAQREPALLVHGIEGLDGATEIAPGTRIYTGGLDAAIDGVLAGRYRPLDFRFFVGRHSGITTAKFEYVAVACARPIALKQCLGLPKPLWHEVMELAGGDLAELSRLEILKRDDLDEPDADPEAEGGATPAADDDAE